MFSTPEMLDCVQDRASLYKTSRLLEQSIREQYKNNMIVKLEEVVVETDEEVVAEAADVLVVGTITMLRSVYEKLVPRYLSETSAFEGSLDQFSLICLSDFVTDCMYDMFKVRVLVNVDEAVVQILDSASVQLTCSMCLIRVDTEYMWILSSIFRTYEED